MCSLLPPPALDQWTCDMIRFDTTLGSFTVDLFEKDAPVTTQNFLEYVDSAIYRHHVPIASSRFRDSGRGG